MWPLEEQSRRKRRVEFGHEAAIGGAQFSVNQVQSGHYGKSSRNRRKRSPRVIPSIRTEGQSHTVSEIQVEVTSFLSSFTHFFQGRSDSRKKSKEGRPNPVSIQCPSQCDRKCPERLRVGAWWLEELPSQRCPRMRDEKSSEKANLCLQIKKDRKQT